MSDAKFDPCECATSVFLLAATRLGRASGATVPSDRPSSSRNRKHGLSWCTLIAARSGFLGCTRQRKKRSAREKQRKKKPDSLATKVKIVCECERERQVLVNIDASIRSHVDAFNDQLGVIETPIT